MRHLWALVLLAAVSRTAHADYADGEVPEGINAFTQPRHTLRLSLLGASAFGITDHTELATYLLGDAVLFPNLRLEHRFTERDETIGMSMMAGVGAGMLPIAGGGGLILPGGAVAGGGAGIAWGSIQTLSAIVSARLAPTLTASVNAGGFAAEGGIAGVIGGVGVGGNGAGGGAAPASIAGSMTGAMAGVEVADTIGKHDAIVIASDAWFFKPLTMDGSSGIIYARAAWTHTWHRFGLTGGAWSLIDLPDAKAFRTAKVPVGLLANVAWTFH